MLSTRQHGHGAGPSPDAATPLVDGGQVAVEVAGVGAAGRDLPAGGGDLAQGFAVARHVGQHDENVPPQGERQMLGDGQRDAGREQPFDHGVAGEVEQQRQLRGRRAPLEDAAHGGRVAMGQSHGSEDDAERRAAGVGLGGDLGGEFQVGQAALGEDGQLLAADQGGQRVDGGDAGDHRLGGRLPYRGVHRETGHRSAVAAEDRGAAVQRPAAPVADPSLPSGPDRDAQRAAGEGDPGRLRPEPSGAFEHLDHGEVGVDIQDEAVPALAGLERDRGVLVPADVPGAPDDDERSAQLRHTGVLDRGPHAHRGVPRSFSTVSHRAAISSSGASLARRIGEKS
nr:hypothetical protein [Nonomuraea sp. MG754425]